MLMKLVAMGKTIDSISKGGAGRVAEYVGDCGDEKPTGRTIEASSPFAAVAENRWVMLDDNDRIGSAEV